MKPTGNEAGGAAGGTTGAGSVLTTSAGGGGSQAAAGGANSGQPAAGGAGGTGTSTGNNTTAGNQAVDWRSQLPKELQEDANLKTILDVPSLAKSFIHAQRAIGAEKIVIPGKHANDDDWKTVFTKLGLPEKLEDYDVKLDESASVDKDFVAKFKDTAHKAGILPHQAQKLATWFQEVNKASEAEIGQAKEKKAATELAALKAEWGAAYEQNLGRAGQLLREAGDEETLKYLDDTGLGNDTKLIKFLAKVGEKFLKEDKSVEGGGGFKPKYTPKDAIVEANKIMSDATHPYNKQEHPNHKAAVDEVKELFEMAYPTAKA